MCYRPFIDKSLTVREEGVAFECGLADYIPSEESLTISKENPKFEDLVLVSYGSKSFFTQFLWSLETWKPVLKDHKMIVFDLGFTDEQVSCLEFMLINYIAVIRD